MTRNHLPRLLALLAILLSLCTPLLAPLPAVQAAATAPSFDRLAIDAADVFLDFDNTKLQALSVTPNPPTGMSTVLQQTFNNTSGAVSLSYGRTTTETGAQGSLNLGKVRFRAVASTPGTPIKFATTAPRKSALYRTGAVVAEPAAVPVVVGVAGVTFTVTPGAANVGADGANFTLSMNTNGEAVDSADVFLDFDPTVLQELDSNNSTTTVTPGSGFQVLQNQVFNSLGRINFSVGRNNGGPALTGAYTLATFRLRALKSSQRTDLTFSRTGQRVSEAFTNGQPVTGPFLAGTTPSLVDAATTAAPR